MLPVTHGEVYTRLHVLLYTLLLFAVTMLPVGTGMGGWIYLVGRIEGRLLAELQETAAYRAYLRTANAHRLVNENAPDSG